MATTNLTHEYTPRGAALQLLTDKTGEILLSGSAGTGKSRAMLEKILIVLLHKPGTQALLLRKTAVALTSTTLVTWRKQVAPEAIKGGLCKWYGGSTEEAAGYRFQNGSKLLVGGMDNPDKVMSSEYDIIGVDEATELSLEDWEKATTRLRNGNLSYTQIIGACNPNSPKHWLKQRCDTGSTKMLVSLHEDNPRYCDDQGRLTIEGVAYIEGILEKLTGVRYLRLRKGVWCAAEGLVHESWSDAVNVIDRFDIPGEWPRLWSVDFGFTHPMVVQCWAIDPDGRMILYREFVKTQMLVEDFARWILKTVRRRDETWIEPKPRRIVCDHDAEGRAVLEKYLGMPATKAHKSVPEGLQAVESRLKVAGDGRPRLMVFRDALVARDPLMDAVKRPQGVVEEVAGYVWETNSKGVKEVPVKDMDDSMDPMRYAVADQDLGLKPRVRWVN